MLVVRRYPSVFGKRDHNYENHWQSIKMIEDIVIDKPTIFCFGGNGIIGEREANAFCKRVESFLELLLKDAFGNKSIPTDFVDLIGISYGNNATIEVPSSVIFSHKDFSFDEYLDKNSEHVNYDYSGTIDEDESERFVKSVLVPLVSSNNTKISLEDSCKNLTNIIFFTWCYGAVATYRILKDFQIRCYELGYTHEEINELLSCLKQVSYAPDTNKNLCPGVYVDSMLDSRNFHRTYEFGKLNGITYKVEEKDDDEFKSFPQIHVVSSRLSNNHENDWCRINEHTFSLLERDKTQEIINDTQSAL